jgi:O-antigen/teichoic acid export membrane protein
MNRERPASHLVGVAIIGQAIAYGLAILVARRLSVTGFEAYVVASAIFILGATLAPLGVEKLTLRRWPALARAQDWGPARGLLRFGVRRTLGTAVAAGAVIAIWAGMRSPAPVRSAILVTCLSLPAGALVHYAVDLLTAAGRPFRALAICRIAVPAAALLVFVATMAFGNATGATAVGAWGAAWLAALGLMAVSLRPRLDPRLLAAVPRIDPGWAREAQPFLVYRAAQSLLAQSGVIALELWGQHGIAVGAFAAAMATTGMAAVLATATNRAYGRDLGLLLEAGDSAGVAALHRRRLAWLLPALAGFLCVALAFPGAILRLFRPEFAMAGATPLRLLALTTAITVLFALAPTQLKFQRRNRVIYSVMAAAAAAQVGLLLVLVPQLGAAGAALAYMLAMGGGYAAFAMLARRQR